MSLKTEGPYIGDLLKYEGEPNYTRTVATIPHALTPLTLGTVLGKIIASGSPGVGAAAAGNVGGGTITAAPVVVGGTAGVYTMVCVTAGPPATFNVLDPNGKVIGVATASAAFTTQFTATITAGGAAFAIGDSFTVTVPGVTNSGDYAPVGEAAVDGSAGAVAVLLYNVPASAVDVKATVLNRGPAIVDQNFLIWPAGATLAEIADGIAQLAAAGISIKVVNDSGQPYPFNSIPAETP